MLLFTLSNVQLPTITDKNSSWEAEQNKGIIYYPHVQLPAIAQKIAHGKLNRNKNSSWETEQIT